MNHNYEKEKDLTRKVPYPTHNKKFPNSILFYIIGCFFLFLLINILTNSLKSIKIIFFYKNVNIRIKNQKSINLSDI